MKDQLNETYWNDRYINNDFGWDVGSVSTPLKEYIDQITNRDISILIPGAGNAYEAEYLLRSGFRNVYVCDLAITPLQNLKKRCPGFEDEQLLHLNFFQLESYSFDLIIEQTFFCALHPSLRRKYFEKVHELLNPKGKLVGVLFNDVLNIDKPPFGGNAEEYKLYFMDLFRIRKYETCYNSIAPRAGREIFINLEKI